MYRDFSLGPKRNLQQGDIDGITALYPMGSTGIEDCFFIDDGPDLIEEDMEKRQGGSQMVFITLKVYDREVYQFAWEAVWEAIGNIQEKYGTDKIFRTHITIIKN